jgi:hypothetical protein
MSDKVRLRLLIVIAFVWVMNMMVFPLMLRKYHYVPDPGVNAIFAIAAGAVYSASRSKGGKDE